MGMKHSSIAEVYVVTTSGWNSRDTASWQGTPQVFASREAAVAEAARLAVVQLGEEQRAAVTETLAAGMEIVVVEYGGERLWGEALAATDVRMSEWCWLVAASPVALQA